MLSRRTRWTLLFCALATSTNHLSLTFDREHRVEWLKAAKECTLGLIPIEIPPPALPHRTAQSHSGLSPVAPFLRVLSIVATAVMAVLTPVQAWMWWANDIGINVASGSMIAMAADLHHGIFYRPIVDSLGYGGTRYAPLYFSLHAGLLALGIPIFPGAYLLSASAVVLLLLGVFFLLRELGVPRIWRRSRFWFCWRLIPCRPPFASQNLTGWPPL